MIIWFLTSLLVLLGCAEAAHLVTLVLDRSLQTYITFCGVFVLAGLFVCLGTGVYHYTKNKKRICMKWQASPYMLVCLVLSVLTIFRLWAGSVPDLDDAVYEIAIGNLHSGSVMCVHPFHGRETQAAMPMRMQILGLSSLYSTLAYVFEIPLYTLLCRIVPVVVWGCGMLLYYVYAQKLFSDDVHKRWVFMSLIAFLYLITMQSEGLLGYKLFHAGFSGETIRAVILMPYVLYVSWQKKWILSCLAVVIEACIVWTTYGAGYCLLIVVCMSAVHFISDRRIRHAA